jgi:hypothetical protein
MTMANRIPAPLLGGCPVKPLRHAQWRECNLPLCTRLPLTE